MDRALETRTVLLWITPVVIHRRTLFFRTSTLHHRLDSKSIIAKKAACDKGFSGFFNSARLQALYTPVDNLETIRGGFVEGYPQGLEDAERAFDGLRLNYTNFVKIYARLYGWKTGCFRSLLRELKPFAARGKERDSCHKHAYPRPCGDKLRPGVKDR